LNAARLNLAVVDGGLLIAFGRAGQVEEEVRAVADRSGAKLGIEFPQDVLAAVQILGLRPGPAAGIPGHA